MLVLVFIIAASLVIVACAVGIDIACAIFAEKKEALRLEWQIFKAIKKAEWSIIVEVKTRAPRVIKTHRRVAAC